MNKPRFSAGGRRPNRHCPGRAATPPYPSRSAPIKRISEIESVPLSRSRRHRREVSIRQLPVLQRILSSFTARDATCWQSGAPRSDHFCTRSFPQAASRETARSPRASSRSPRPASRHRRSPAVHRLQQHCAVARLPVVVAADNGWLESSSPKAAARSSSEPTNLFKQKPLFHGGDGVIRL